MVRLQTGKYLADDKKQDFGKSFGHACSGLDEDIVALSLEFDPSNDTNQFRVERNTQTSTKCPGIVIGRRIIFGRKKTVVDDNRFTGRRAVGELLKDCAGYTDDPAGEVIDDSPVNQPPARKFGEYFSDMPYVGDSRNSRRNRA